MGQSNTTTRIAITVCAAVATGIALCYYFYKKEMEKSREALEPGSHLSSKEQIVTTRGPISRRKDRFPTAKHLPSPRSDLATAKSSTSNETLLTARLNLSGSMKTDQQLLKSEQQSDKGSQLLMSALSPASSRFNRFPKASSRGSVSASPSQKARTLAEKLQELSDNKIMSSDAQLAAAEKVDKSKSSESSHTSTDDTPSPREVIPIDSYCYCGQDVIIASNMGELDDSYKVELLPTIVKPVSFDPYSPEDLTQVEGTKEELSQNSLQVIPVPKNHYIIIPFLPILHAITHASKHAQLLQELMQNYEYFESQALDGSSTIFA